MDTITADAIPVTLVVEAGRLKMSAAQLMELRAGNVLELDAQTALFDLSINGKRVGRGELVHVGQSLAIRVHEIG